MTSRVAAGTSAAGPVHSRGSGREFGSSRGWPPRRCLDLLRWWGWPRPWSPTGRSPPWHTLRLALSSTGSPPQLYPTGGMHCANRAGCCVALTPPWAPLSTAEDGPGRLGPRERCKRCKRERKKPTVNGAIHYERWRHASFSTPRPAARGRLAFATQPTTTATTNAPPPPQRAWVHARQDATNWPVSTSCFGRGADDAGRPAQGGGGQRLDSCAGCGLATVWAQDTVPGAVRRSRQPMVSVI